MVLDVPPTVGLARVRERASGTDRLEAEDYGFHERVRPRFLELARAEPVRYLLVDATQTAPEVAYDVRHAVERLLEQKRRANAAV